MDHKIREEILLVYTFANKEGTLIKTLANASDETFITKLYSKLSLYPALIG